MANFREKPANAPRLWVPEGLASGAHLVLPERAARHVAALRLAPDDAVCLFDGGGGEWHATLTRIGRGGDRKSTRLNSSH